MRIGYLVSVFALMGCESDKTITIKDPPPLADIISHGDGSEVLEGLVVSFEGNVSDSTDAPDDLRATWKVNGEVVCPATPPDEGGLTACEMVLGLDETEITLEARDTQNTMSFETITVLVIETSAPFIEIISPQGDGRYYEDQKISFQGVLSDAEDDPDQLVAYWESDLDGILSDVDSIPDASGTIIGYDYLSEGEHAIELHVEDSTGKISTESLIINVGPANSEPLCEIRTPVDGSAGISGETVEFTGMASDVDIEAEQLSVVWSSDKDGEIGRSIPNSDGEIIFAYSDLTVNTHTISLQVSDEVGATCTTTMLYTVGTAPSVNIESPLSGETYVEGESIAFIATVSDTQDQPNHIALDWTLNSTAFSTQTATSSGEAQFLDSSLAPGSYNLVVLATDSDGLTDSAQISFTVNGRPSAPEVSISPATATTSSVLTANIDLASVDPEGATVSYHYQWLQNNVVTPTYTTASIPASATTKGESWEVRVTPDDGVATGDVGSAQITIGNTEPTISSVSITPVGTAYNDDTLDCLAAAIDPDETPTLSYQWTVNGAIVGLASRLDLAPLALLPRSELVCAVTATDGDGASVTDSVSNVLGNRAPVLSGTAITPSTGISNTSLLSCQSTVSDPDGEVLTPSYTWSIGDNGNLSESATLQLSPETVSSGDEIRCSVEVADGYGATASDSVSISIDILENALPVVDAIQLSPASIYTNDTITATVALSDADSQQSLSATYDWYVDGGTTPVQSGTSSVLSGVAHFEKGQTVQVVVTPSDGQETGVSVTSEVVSILNTPPSPPVISLSANNDPAEVGVDDLTCLVVQEASDDDAVDTSFTYTYTWYDPQDVPVQTVETAALRSVYAGADTALGTWTCAVVASDGDADSTIVEATVVVGEAGCLSTPISLSTLPDGAVTWGGAGYGSQGWDASGYYEHQSDHNKTLIPNIVENNELRFEIELTRFQEEVSVMLNLIEVDSGPTTFAEMPLWIVLGVDSNTMLTHAEHSGASFADKFQIFYAPDTGSSVSDASLLFSGDLVASLSDWSTVQVRYDNDTDLLEFKQNGVLLASVSAPVDLDLTSIMMNTTARGRSANVGWRNLSTICPEEDLDGDDVRAWDDCDDGDPSSTVLAEDADCDGVLTDEDCDDGDPSDAVLSGDCDQDGVLAADDCDDADPSLLAIADDPDCDGVVCGLTDCDTNLDFGGGQSMDLVLIPAGTFMMGSPSNEIGRDAGEIEHEVTLTNDYYVMTTEVTQGMFAELMGYEAYDEQPTSDGGGSYGVGADYPAYYVSWHMAADFANAVTQQHNALHGVNLQECYSCSGTGTSVNCTASVNPYQCTGYRLLTEAEWEYAARSGSTAAFWTPNGGGDIPIGYEDSVGCSESWTLSDGTFLGDLGWFCGNLSANNSSYSYGSKEVATREPNGNGLYDMVGNVLEWTQDYHGTYSTDPVINPTEILGSSGRIIRGGSWSHSPFGLRSAKRGIGSPTYRSDSIGFRLAQTFSEDVDQDGVLSLNDCDDTDASSTIVADDADCDGVLSDDYVDDNNSSLSVWTEIWSHSLDSQPDASIFYDGGWLGQGVATVYGRDVWFQESDWNILFIPVERSLTSWEAVEVDVYLPEHSTFDFSPLQSKDTSYGSVNGLHWDMSIDTNLMRIWYADLLSYNGYLTNHVLIEGDLVGNYRPNMSGSLSGFTVGVWQTLRVEYNSTTEETRFYIDGEPLYTTMDIPISLLDTEYVTLSGFTVCCSSPADVAWSNLRVYAGE